MDISEEERARSVKLGLAVHEFMGDSVHASILMAVNGQTYDVEISKVETPTKIKEDLASRLDWSDDEKRGN